MCVHDLQATEGPRGEEEAMKGRADLCLCEGPATLEISHSSSDS